MKKEMSFFHYPSGFLLLPLINHLLFTIHPSPLTIAHCPLLIAHCPLPIANCPLPLHPLLFFLGI
jgi:hypothetical protein